MTTTPHETPSSSLERPTQVRYLVVALATMMAALLYLDRFFLSFLLPYISQELALQDYQDGMLLSVFFFAYALGQVPSGWLSDRFGARLMLTVYIVGWSLLTGLMVMTGWTGKAGAFVFLLALRFGFGLFQAGAYPTSAGMISKWVPFSLRATASSVVAMGGRFGGFAQAILTAYLLVAFVPLSISSFLNQDDIIDPAGFLDKLEPSQKAPPSSMETTGTEQTGNNPEEKEDSKKAATKTLLAEIRKTLDIPIEQLKKLPAEEQKTHLQTVLDKILKRPELYEKVNIEEFKLPKEAERLADLPPEDLTEEKVTRRNRLLLEAAFPDHIGYIYRQGWRPVALVYGLVGLVVALLFWLGVRNSPHNHPGCNQAERNLIEQGRPSTSDPHGKVGRLPIHYMVTSRSLWLSSLSQFGTNFGWAFIVLLLPEYLEKAHHVPVIQRGWMAGLPILVGMVGMLNGGWLTDVLTRTLGLRWGRGLPMAATRFMAMTAYLSCLVLDSPWLITMAFCVVTISTDLGTSSIWAFKQDIGGRYVGSVLGWGNMWGNFGAAVSPLVLTAFYGPLRWQLCFLACATAFAISGFAALGVDARIPIVPKEE